ncbi:MAG: Fur family transcriptional regulator [Bacillota bacterium]|nr:Fur family transcriptional regulator [Bacillota bacterium]
MSTKLDKIYTIIGKSEYKLTTQRKNIIDIILKNEDKHFNCEDIYDEIREIDSNIGLATIYRTLKIFVGLDILTELNFGDGSIRYDIKCLNDGHNHHHLVCTKCGKIIEVKDDSLEDLEREIEEIYGFQVENHKCKFTGICKDCLQNS